ncbi:hypothetical protein KZ860_30710, partial [Pseudomonas aeruginosa]|nr:hypothetical protein [Pseudomonas aeruginosa]
VEDDFAAELVAEDALVLEAGERVRRLGLRDAGLRRIDRGARTHRHRRLFPGRGLQQLRPRGCGERQRLAGQPTGYLHRAQEGAATLFFDQISGTGN